ncbi:MAG: hypothetical protein HGB32_14995 [Geobacteraceae bacterium]|nr:hypothetical protein [Geobacteraceae bacterium]NTW81431.1 hypothetical protein [Geobacteraceae bacterium]
MGSTTHRRDITGEDFTRLAKLSSSLSTMDSLYLRPCWNLWDITMLLPVWFHSSTGWRLDRYKEFKRDAYGITVPDFRRICRYIKVTEPQMIDTLYRMSMISVVKGQKSYERPKFKMLFQAGLISADGWEKDIEAFGFVIERRRADGAFRQEGL